MKKSEAVRAGVVSKYEAELAEVVEKISRLLKGNLRTSKRSTKKNSRKRR